MLLAGIGTLMAHEVAYLTRAALVSAGGAAVSHAHLPVLWGFGTAIAVAAITRTVVLSLRSRAGARSVDSGLLAIAMIALYVSQEAAELWWSGQPAISLLAQPTLWLGVAAAPLVALLLARLVDTVVELVAIVPTSRHRVGSDPLFTPARVEAFLPLLIRLAHSVSRRGPPRVVATY